MLDIRFYVSITHLCLHSQSGNDRFLVLQLEQCLEVIIWCWWITVVAFPLIDLLHQVLCKVWNELLVLLCWPNRTWVFGLWPTTVGNSGQEMVGHVVERRLVLFSKWRQACILMHSPLRGFINYLQIVHVCRLGALWAPVYFVQYALRINLVQRCTFWKGTTLVTAFISFLESMQ